MLNYRVYSYYKGLHTLGIKDNIQDTIDLIESHIYKENANYLVIEHNTDLNMDLLIESIHSIEDFLIFKEKHTPVNKVKKLKN